MAKRNGNNKSLNFNLLFIVGVVCILLVLFVLQAKGKISPQSGMPISNEPPNPQDFSTTITNKYFSLPPGIKIIYEEPTDEGVERIEIIITGETKVINGIETLVYWDRVWLNGQLIEDTRDYLAQHKNGDVWYFGEDVDNYSKGKLVNHGGSWLAGEDGARAGIWVKQNPRVGESYQQEYYFHEAEDMADIISLKETVTTPYGTFTNCLKTRDWTPLDPASLEYKYYCPEVRMLVLEHDIPTGEEARLIDIQRAK